MTATVLPTAAPRTRAAAAAPPLWRLTAVELRKMADTRAGIWLLGIIELLAAVVIVIRLFTGDAESRSLADYFTLTLFPVNLLLPVLGVLSVTSEWSQRSALTTFALTPRRERVAVAKLAAMAAIAALSVVACLATAVVGNLITNLTSTVGGSWHLTAASVGYAVLFQLLGMLLGFGFGMLFMNSAASIVLYFALPLAWTAAGGLISSLDKAAEWLDMGRTLGPLLEDQMTAGNWARLGTSVALWVLLPIALGTVRLLRREVK